MSPVNDAVHLLKGMFLEMPGARLSVQEASRLSGLDVNTCAAILDAFVDAQFLKRSSTDWFVRSVEGAPGSTSTRSARPS
jgi:hypothetical protein